MKINCELITVWDGGTEIRTPALYDSETGEVESLSSSDAPVEVLEKEYIEFADGNTIQVCTHCHEYTLKDVVRPSAGKVLVDDVECRNPDCDNKI
jgi:phage baseplate assembly protein gpV